MKNVWEKIKNWFKKNWGYFAAAVGGFIAALFTGFCSGKHRGLDSDKRICESAADGVAKTTESVASASRELDSAEGTVEQLKQSIESSETRLDDSADTVGELIRNTESVASVLERYNKGIEQSSNPK